MKISIAVGQRMVRINWKQQSGKMNGSIALRTFRSEDGSEYALKYRFAISAPPIIDSTKILYAGFDTNVRHREALIFIYKIDAYRSLYKPDVPIIFGVRFCID